MQPNKKDIINLDDDYFSIVIKYYIVKLIEVNYDSEKYDDKSCLKFLIAAPRQVSTRKIEKCKQCKMNFEFWNISKYFPISGFNWNNFSVLPVPTAIIWSFVEDVIAIRALPPTQQVLKFLGSVLCIFAHFQYFQDDVRFLYFKFKRFTIF